MSFASLCLFCFISTLQSPSVTGQKKKQKRKKTKNNNNTFATSNLIFDIALECSYINVNITAWLVNVGRQANFE